MGDFVNGYDWTGEFVYQLEYLDNKTILHEPNFTKFQRMFVKPGIVGGVEGRYRVIEFVQPLQVPDKWLRRSPKRVANRIYLNGTYIGDKELYSQREHWEDLDEYFFQKRRGDCDAHNAAFCSYAEEQELKPRLCFGISFNHKDGPPENPKIAYNHVIVLLDNYPDFGIEGGEVNEIYAVDCTPPRGVVRGWYKFKEAGKFKGFLPTYSIDMEGNIYKHRGV